MFRLATRFGAPAPLGLTLIATIACASNAEPPRQECRTILWARTTATQIDVVGSWDDWTTPGLALESRPDGWWVAALTLPAGEHEYQMVERGKGVLDERNPLSTYRKSDGVEVSLLTVPNCEEPALAIDAIEETPDGALVTATFLAPATGGRAVAGELLGEGGARIGAVTVEPATGAVHATVDGLERGPHRVTLSVRDDAGTTAEARVRVWVDPLARREQDEIIYQVLVDRFRGDAGVVLASPPSPGAWAGGTLDGVRAELEAGWFEALGVSTLWISPVYANPEGERLGTDGRLYEGYHGYWVENSRAVDERFGGAAQLHELVAAAHHRGVKVVLDVVPNHVYETNPVWTERPNDDWFNIHPDACVCGTEACPWSEHQTECWFTDYLPDLRMENRATTKFAADEIAWWVDEYDLDGVRLDAVPMMPRSATRWIVHRLAELYSSPDALLTIGEVFTGPGGLGTLRYYLGPDGLDSVFDFPLMWALRARLGEDSLGFDDLAAGLDATDVQLEGSGTSLARIIDNHDTSRLVSELAGDVGADPWESPPPQPLDPDVYLRQGLALGLILTLPGMPTLYYGDEVGLAGADDPDSRRVMPSIDLLSADRRALLDRVRRLGQLRRCSPALRAADRRTQAATHDGFAFTRGEGGALVVVSSGRSSAEVAIPAGAVPSGTWVDALSGDKVQVDATGVAIPMPRLSLRVFLPEGDPCAS